MKKKTIVIKLVDEEIRLVTQYNMHKGSVNSYNICFVGIDKSKTHLAQIESLTMKSYMALDKKGFTDIPSMFKDVSEMSVRLVTLDGDKRDLSNAVYIKQR